MNQNEVIIGVFPDHKKADDAIKDLEKNGVDASNVSIIMKSPGEGKPVAGDKNISVVGGVVKNLAGGAGTGGIIGGLLGLLVGITAITIPGLGGLLIAGPVAEALGLTGAAATTVTGAVTGATLGGLIGIFEGIGASREDAKMYAKYVQDGAILVAVPAMMQQELQVEDIMKEHDAQQVGTIPLRGQQ